MVNWTGQSKANWTESRVARRRRRGPIATFLRSTKQQNGACDSALLVWSTIKEARDYTRKKIWRMGGRQQRHAADSSYRRLPAGGIEVHDEFPPGE